MMFFYFSLLDFFSYYFFRAPEEMTKGEQMDLLSRKFLNDMERDCEA